MKFHEMWHVLLITALVVLGSAGLVIAADEPAPATSVTEESTSDWDPVDVSVATTSAYAGNITALTLDGSSQTKYWQGYFGNITGTIVLRDSNNYTLYNWSTAEPQGEIYTSVDDTITWSKIQCFNYIADETTNGTNVTTWEQYHAIADLQYDGINETYNTTNPEEFWVGDTTIAAGTCPSTYMFEETGWQTNNWINVLLTDNSTLIHTTIIENRQYGNLTDKDCFNGQPCDFQMIVPEAGNNATAAATPTTYYFWVELE